MPVAAHRADRRRIVAALLCRACVFGRSGGRGVRVRQCAGIPDAGHLPSRPQHGNCPRTLQAHHRLARLVFVFSVSLDHEPLAGAGARTGTRRPRRRIDGCGRLALESAGHPRGARVRRALVFHPRAVAHEAVHGHRATHDCHGRSVRGACRRSHRPSLRPGAETVASGPRGLPNRHHRCACCRRNDCDRPFRAERYPQRGRARQGCIGRSRCRRLVCDVPGPRALSSADGHRGVDRIRRGRAGNRRALRRIRCLSTPTRCRSSLCQRLWRVARSPGHPSGIDSGKLLLPQRRAADRGAARRYRPARSRSRQARAAAGYPT
jgi:hypothetical protein